MKFFEELTEWSDSTPNHVYLLSDGKDKMFAYVRQGTNNVVTFSKPLRFDARKRKFREVPNIYKYDTAQHDTVTKAKTWKVKGSKGDTYTVTEGRNGLFCTCSGFKFRGHCKHVDQVNEENTNTQTS